MSGGFCPVTVTVLFSSNIYDNVCIHTYLDSIIIMICVMR